MVDVDDDRPGRPRSHTERENIEEVQNSGRIRQSMSELLDRTHVGRVSRGFADRMFGDDPETSEGGWQPLTADENREQFQRSQREAMRQVLERSPMLSCSLCLVSTSYLVLNTTLHVLGWWVWYKNYKKECDQPLPLWLLLNLCQPGIVSVLSMCLEGATSSGYISGSLPRVIWCVINQIPLQLFILGVIWFVNSETCEETNPNLYGFVKFYLLYLVLSMTFFLLLSFAFVALLIYGLMHGWFDDQAQGADPATIEQLETVPFSVELFRDNGEGGSNQKECCICTEPFGPDKIIKQTPCAHHFHEECLKPWLRVSKLCPLCRSNLEEAVFPEGGHGRGPHEGMNAFQAIQSAEEAQEQEDLVRAIQASLEEHNLQQQRQLLQQQRQQQQQELQSPV